MSGLSPGPHFFFRGDSKSLTCQCPCREPFEGPVGHIRWHRHETMLQPVVQPNSDALVVASAGSARCQRGSRQSRAAAVCHQYFANCFFAGPPRQIPFGGTPFRRLSPASRKACAPPKAQRANQLRIVVAVILSDGMVQLFSVKKYCLRPWAIRVWMRVSPSAAGEPTSIRVHAEHTASL